MTAPISPALPSPLPGLFITGFELGPFATNSYVIEDRPSSTCWVVDPSFEPEELLNFLRQRKLAVVRIVLTHAHIDHIAGLDELAAACTAAGGPVPPITMHAAEVEWLATPALNLSSALGGGFRTELRASDVVSPPRTMSEAGPSASIVRTLGPHTFTLLHTPGHSPGSISLVNLPNRAIISGDLLMAGSVGRTDFPNSNHWDLVQSIRRGLYPLPEEMQVYPGHGPTTTIGREKQFNQFVRAT